MAKQEVSNTQFTQAQASNPSPGEVLSYKHHMNECTPRRMHTTQARSTLAAHLLVSVRWRGSARLFWRDE